MRRLWRGWLAQILPSILLLTSMAAAIAAAEEPGGVGEEAPALVGALTRDQIEAAVPDWIEEEMTASPDPAASSALVEALTGAEITVFLGTWCSDSRRELARLWRALDEAGALDPAEIRYIGVDRDKLEPSPLVEGADLSFVPTFVVRRDGSELGRIVETAPAGIEHDLLALLRGDKAGVITASEDPANKDAADE